MITFPIMITCLSLPKLITIIVILFFPSVFLFHSFFSFPFQQVVPAEFIRSGLMDRGEDNDKDNECYLISGFKKTSIIGKINQSKRT